MIVKFFESVEKLEDYVREHHLGYFDPRKINLYSLQFPNIFCLSRPREEFDTLELNIEEIPTEEIIKFNQYVFECWK